MATQQDFDTVETLFFEIKDLGGNVTLLDDQTPYVRKEVLALLDIDNTGIVRNFLETPAFLTEVDDSPQRRELMEKMVEQLISKR